MKRLIKMLNVRHIRTIRKHTGKFVSINVLLLFHTIFKRSSISSIRSSIMDSVSVYGNFICIKKHVSRRNKCRIALTKSINYIILNI